MNFGSSSGCVSVCVRSKPKNPERLCLCCESKGIPIEQSHNECWFLAYSFHWLFPNHFTQTHKTSTGIKYSIYKFGYNPNWSCSINKIQTKRLNDGQQNTKYGIQSKLNYSWLVVCTKFRTIPPLIAQPKWELKNRKWRRIRNRNDERFILKWAQFRLSIIHFDAKWYKYIRNSLTFS